MSFNGGNSTVDLLSTLDSLGRPLYTQKKQSPSSSNYDSAQRTYDALDALFKTTVPYVGTAGQASPQGTATTTTNYDTLGRPTLVTDGGNGTATISYTKNDVLQIIGPAPSGENTKQKQLEYDALGRLTSVCEITGGSGSGACGQNVSQTGFLTTYAYDTTTLNSVLVNRTTVTQNAQPGGTAQTRTFLYDLLGRLVQETNPENGTTSYVYDSDATCGTQNGDLAKRTDAVGNVTCYAHDQLHRVLNITYPSGSYSASTPKKYFVYDSATVNGSVMANPKGRLAEAYTCTGSCTSKITDLGFSYSVRGEVSDVYESTPHSGGYYHLTASYFPHGALNALSGVPGLPTIYYGGHNDSTGLDGEGRYLKVTASTGANPATSVTYTNSGTTQPIGSLTQVVFGSADSDAFSYDTGTGRMNQYKYNVGSQSVTGNLTWNANGSLGTVTITDQLNTANSQTCTYGHDDLARIASVNCGTAWSQTFGPDAFGNITKSGSSSFLPTYSAATNRFLTIPGGTPTYDNNGNLTNDLSHTYSWDAEGKALAVDTVNLTYDALGRMVEQARGSSYTEIVYSPRGGKLALMNGQTLQKAFVRLPGGGTAVYTSSGLAYYRHADWLGSSRLASTPSRTKYYDVAYAPYGETYAGSGTTDLNFTGQNQDTVSGLYDFLYREYHQAQGRWVSPDPAGLAAVNPANPQSWNRYAYALNSPLNETDPIGLRPLINVPAFDALSWQSWLFGLATACGAEGCGTRAGWLDLANGIASWLAGLVGDDCPADACVTASASSAPCIIIIGGVADNQDDPTFNEAADSVGGIYVAPYNGTGSRSIDIPGSIVGVAVNSIICTAACETTGNLISSYEQANPQGLLLLSFSGGGQATSSAANNKLFDPSGIAGIIYMSPGAPGGYSQNLKNVPTFTTWGSPTSTLDAAVYAVNGTLLLDGTASQFPPGEHSFTDCGHDFGCEFNALGLGKGNCNTPAKTSSSGENDRLRWLPGDAVPDKKIAIAQRETPSIAPYHIASTRSAVAGD